MIFSIASQKGGVGKTSSSISLSAGLARKGKTVLLVDIDSQANSSKVLLHDYQHLTADQTLYRTMDAVVESLQHTNKKLGDEGTLFATLSRDRQYPTGIYADIADIKERLEELEKIINMYWAPRNSDRLSRPGPQRPHRA